MIYNIDTPYCQMKDLNFEESPLLKDCQGTPRKFIKNLISQANSEKDIERVNRLEKLLNWSEKHL